MGLFVVLRVCWPQRRPLPGGPGGAGSQSIVGFFEFCAHPWPVLPHWPWTQYTRRCNICLRPPHSYRRVRGDKERRVRISKHFRKSQITLTHIYTLCPVGIIFIQASLFHHMNCRCRGRKFRKSVYRLCLAQQPSSARNARESAGCTEWGRRGRRHCQAQPGSHYSGEGKWREETFMGIIKYVVSALHRS
jgi:hypothetical protein